MCTQNLDMKFATGVVIVFVGILIVGFICLSQIRGMMPFLDNPPSTHADAVVYTALALRTTKSRGQALSNAQIVEVGAEINSSDALLRWLHGIYPHVDFRGAEWRRAAAAFVESRDQRGNIREQMGEVLLLADFIHERAQNEAQLRLVYESELKA